MGIVLILISVGVVSAELVYKQNTEVTISLPCENNGSYCSGSSLCNITIAKPDGDLLIVDKQMTNQFSFHNYSLGSNETTELGDYFTTVRCIDDSESGISTFNYLITRSGKVLDTSEALTYILVTVGIFFIFALSLFFTIKVPYSNKKNEKGELVEITKTKYVKMGLVLITHSLFVWFLNVLIGVSDNFLNLGMYFGFVSFLFTMLVRLSLPLFIMVFVLLFFEIIRDINRQKLLDMLFNKIK